MGRKMVAEGKPIIECRKHRAKRETDEKTRNLIGRLVRKEVKIATADLQRQIDQLTGINDWI